MTNKANKSYYFVGIKGSGMSAMALILHDRGYKVLGSDIDKYTFTQRGLEKAGIKVLPFNTNNIKENLMVITGNAFKNDQPEIKKALNMHLPVYNYSDFLGELIKGSTSIGIAGAHGKTSTTGLLAHVLSGIAPTDYLIGDGSGKGIPDAQFFVYEADEYRRHFLATHPDYAIVTNIDFDHPDYYKNIKDVFNAFQEFERNVKRGIVVFGDDPLLKKLSYHVPVSFYGFGKENDFQAINIKKTTAGSEFKALYHGKEIGAFQIPLFGEHNILNSLSVIAIAYLEGIDLNKVKQELNTFKGVKRRFSERKIEDMTIIDDYAHHPSEIKATLDAARQEYPNKKIIVVFQPHTFSRTIAYLDDFAKELNKADEVYITNIYGSPRENSGKISSKDLEKKITKSKGIINFDNMSPLLDNHDAVVIFMGAGDIQKYEHAYEDLFTHLSKKSN